MRSPRHPIHICRVGARPAQQGECRGADVVCNFEVRFERQYSCRSFNNKPRVGDLDDGACAIAPDKAGRKTQKKFKKQSGVVRGKKPLSPTVSCAVVSRHPVKGVCGRRFNGSGGRTQCRRHEGCAKCVTRRSRTFGSVPRPLAFIKKSYYLYDFVFL